MFKLEATPLFITELKEWLTKHSAYYSSNTPEEREESISFLTNLAFEKMQKAYVPANLAISLSPFHHKDPEQYHNFVLRPEHFTVHIFNSYTWSWISAPYGSTEFKPVINDQ